MTSGVPEPEVTAIDHSVASPPKDRRDDALVQIYPPGPHIGRKHHLTTTETLIGRDETCPIRIDNKTVSRAHARIRTQNGERWIMDLQSTNGTLVNDTRISSSLLRHGDRIKIGDSIFKYLEGADVELLYHEEIYRMTITDGLTGAYNKRYFMDELSRELARSIRHQRPLSLIMLDVDNFKSVNDIHGHLTGDAVLRQLSRLITERIRRDEIFARYGGEEFALILPETTRENALTLAETLRKRVQQTHTEETGFPCPITISLGIASTCGDTIGIEAFIQQADSRLYDAKNNGRNCVQS